VKPLGDLGIRLVGLVGLEGGVRAIEGRIEADVVAHLGAVLEEHRQLGQRGVALLQVVLAGEGPQVEDLEVLGERHADAVDIRQLIARRVHAHVVGIALEHPRGRIDGIDRLPWRKHGQFGIEPPVPAVPDIADHPSKPAAFAFFSTSSLEENLGRNCLM
jgi:hypothetical protein